MLSFSHLILRFLTLKKFRFSFALLLFHSLSLHANMQETGLTPPSPFYSFDLPQEVLPFLRNFLPKNPIIVEAGAYHGKETSIMATFWPKGHVHAFEPVHELYEIVKNTTHHLSNVSTYPLALGDRLEKRLMHLSTETFDREHISMSSSLYPPKEHLIYSATLFEGHETVDVITLDIWAKKYGISKIDMLWLDMQGYELPALKAALNILKTVSVILTEVEFAEGYEGQPLYREVKEWLESQGFVLIGGNFSFPKHPRQWFGDALFVRKELIH